MMVNMMILLMVFKYLENWDKREKKLKKWFRENWDGEEIEVVVVDINNNHKCLRLKNEKKKSMKRYNEYNRKLKMIKI